MFRAYHVTVQHGAGVNNNVAMDLPVPVVVGCVGNLARPFWLLGSCVRLGWLPLGKI